MYSSNTPCPLTEKLENWRVKALVLHRPKHKYKYRSAGPHHCHAKPPKHSDNTPNPKNRGGKLSRQSASRNMTPHPTSKRQAHALGSTQIVFNYPKRTLSSINAHSQTPTAYSSSTTRSTSSPNPPSPSDSAITLALPPPSP